MWNYKSKLEIKNKKLKIPSKNDRIFNVEPRGVEPLYPNGNYEFLTRGGPLDSTSARYHFINKKERPSLSSDFQDSSESVIAIFSIASTLSVSMAIVDKYKEPKFYNQIKKFL